MAKKNILDQYRNPVFTDASDTDTRPDTPVSSEPVICGNLVSSGGLAAYMLDVRLKDGTRTALPYGYLSKIRLNPTGTLTLHFPDATVTITGRHLGVIYAAVCNHTAIAIVEDSSGFDGGRDEPFVESVSVVQTGAE